MAKIFGFYRHPSNIADDNDLFKMERAYQIDFGSSINIKNGGINAGVAVLNKFDSQPVTQKDGSLELLSMGKIYMPERLKNQLFKKILNAINTDNTEILNKILGNINGTFIMLIYDTRRDKTYIINDRYGSEPLYYYCDGRMGLIFASEIKAIISNSFVKRIINWNFWKDFFEYGYAMGGKTPFSNVISLPNASILSFQNGKVEILRYWDYGKIKVNYNLTKKAAIDKGVDVLKNVFKRQSNGLKKCIVPLSGGYDSRCISCSLKKYTNTSFENYSSNLHPSGGNLDYTLAKQVSTMLKVKNIFVGRPKEMYKKYFKNHFLILDGLVTEHKWMLPLVNSIKTELPNFDGIAGDVLLRGPFLTLNNINELDSKKLTDFFNTQIVIKGRRERCQLIYKYFDSSIADKLRPDNISMFDEFNKLGDIDNKATIFYLKNRTKNAISISGRNLIYRKVYSYFPFFDNEFVEYALSIPPQMKLFGQLYFDILKKAFPEIMKIPTTNDNFLKSRLLDIDTKKLENFPIKQKIIIDEDLHYLLKLVKTVSPPSFINKIALLNQIKTDIEDGVDPKKYLASVLQFCIWYNEYSPSV